MRRRRSTVARIRSALYTGGKVLGHVRALQTGRVFRRIMRVMVGKWASRWMGRMFK